MIPLKSFATQEEGSDDGEDSEGDNLLKHFELHKVHRTTVADITDTIGGNHKTILEEGDTPREEDHTD